MSDPLPAVEIAADQPLDADTAATLAQALQALATPSRLLILDRLRRQQCTVTELAAAVDMEQSAVSHQLRLLRTLGFVVGERSGRSITYRLHDEHVAGLIDQAITHAQHLPPRG